MTLPTCDATSRNDILFAFRPPASGLHIGDVIEFDPHIQDAPQTALNATTGAAFTLEIRSNDVHDIRLPAFHGSLRTPSREMAECRLTLMLKIPKT
jgi:hypothetical protein